MGETALAIDGGPKVRTRPWPPHGVLGAAEEAAVAEVVRRGRLFRFEAGARAVAAFEELFGALHGGRTAVAVHSGTAALHTCLAAAGVEPGDEVVVPPITWFATATACLHQGAVPVFADVDPATGMLTAETVAPRITPRTRAIVLVHIFGYPADAAPLRALADQCGIALIEDAAQALGARREGLYAGMFGHLAAFSLQQSKSITTGDGGVVLAENRELGRRAAMFADHGLDRTAPERGPQFLGYNYRMPELSGAVARAQLERLEAFNAQRRANAAALAAGLAGIRGLVLPPWEPLVEPAWWLFPVRVDPAALGMTRERFAAALAAEGIPTGRYPARPVPWEPIFAERRAFPRTGWPFALPSEGGAATWARGGCPRAEAYWEHLVTLPCHHALDESDMADVVAAVRKVAAAAAG